jgi:hypothetical protein
VRQLLARNIKVYPGKTLRYLSFHDHCHQYKIMLYPTQHLMRTRHRALAGYCVGCEKNKRMARLYHLKNRTTNE